MTETESLVYRKICNDTREKLLSWHCGSHSDVWDASHKDYSVRVRNNLFSVILNIYTALPGGRCPLYISWSRWRQLLQYIREPDARTLDDVYRAMCGGVTPDNGMIGPIWTF